MEKKNYPLFYCYLHRPGHLHASGRLPAAGFRAGLERHTDLDLLLRAACGTVCGTDLVHGRPVYGRTDFLSLVSPAGTPKPCPALLQPSAVSLGSHECGEAKYSFKHCFSHGSPSAVEDRHRPVRCRISHCRILYNEVKASGKAGKSRKSVLVSHPFLYMAQLLLWPQASRIRKYMRLRIFPRPLLFSCGISGKRRPGSYSCPV